MAASPMDHRSDHVAPHLHLALPPQIDASPQNVCSHRNEGLDDVDMWQKNESHHQLVSSSILQASPSPHHFLGIPDNMDEVHDMPTQHSGSRDKIDVLGVPEMNGSVKSLASDSPQTTQPQSFQSKAYRLIIYDPEKEPRGWKTMPFIIGNEISVSVASYGLTWNLIIYLIQEYHIGEITATNVVNIFSGTRGITPIVGAFLADSYFGRFLTIFVSSIFNLLGMVFLLLTATVTSLRPVSCSVPQLNLCPHATRGQLAFLYVSFLLLSLGAGGLNSCTYAFGADQFRGRTAEEQKQLQSFFNWYYFCQSVSLLVSSTVIVYLQTSVGWGWGFGVPTVAMLIGIIIFISGLRLYRRQRPEGSILTKLLQEAVAVIRNRKVKLPSDSKDFMVESCCNLNSGILQSQDQSKPTHTSDYKFLDKAAMKTEGDIPVAKEESRDVSTLQKVNDLKSLIRIAPIWASGIMLSANLSQLGTFLVLQARSMDRSIGQSFEIPSGSIGVFMIVSLLLWLPLYDRVIVPTARRFTGNIRGVTLLQRIAIGSFISSVSMVVAGLVEGKRRQVARSSGHVDDQTARLPISVFWLLPQLFMLGIAESFNAIGQLEFFYDQLPSHMVSLSGALFSCSFAIGNYVSTILIKIVHEATARNGGTDWLADNFNKGHLDRFYYLLALLLLLNFFYVLACAHSYTYKSNVVRSDMDGESDRSATE